VRRRPAHAGRLRLRDRFVFTLVFALMATFVVVVMVSSAEAGKLTPHSAAGTSRTAAAGVTAPKAGEGQGGAGPTYQRAQSGGNDRVGRILRQAKLDKRLTAALRPVIGDSPARIAVGVIDKSTGTEACYQCGRYLYAGSIIKADILAILLLQHQQAGTSLTGSEDSLAAQMIESADASPAASLLRLAGGEAAIRAANTALHLRHTLPRAARSWGLTSTTVADQLRLLTDLTAAGSPLHKTARAYELSLMADMQAGRSWGVPAAATGGTSYAVMDAWLAGPRLWDVNSIGVVVHDGQQLLIAVLSESNPSEAGGIARNQAAAVAAADMITRAGS